MSDKIAEVFENAYKEASNQEFKEAMQAMYRIYTELQNAGFSKTEAMQLLIALFVQIRCQGAK